MYSPFFGDFSLTFKPNVRPAVARGFQTDDNIYRIFHDVANCGVTKNAQNKVSVEGQVLVNHQPCLNTSDQHVKEAHDGANDQRKFYDPFVNSNIVIGTMQFRKKCDRSVQRNANANHENDVKHENHDFDHDIQNDVIDPSVLWRWQQSFLLNGIQILLHSRLQSAK